MFYKIIQLRTVLPESKHIAEINETHWQSKETTEDWLKNRADLAPETLSVFSKLTGDLDEGSRIMVIGFGPKTGEITFFADKGYKVSGLEINKGFIDKAKNLNLPNVRIIEKSVAKYKFGPDKWGLVVMLDVANWLPEEYWGATLKKIYNGLISGGHLYLRWPEGDGYIPKPGPERYIFHILKDKLIALLQKAGFDRDNIFISKVTGKLPDGRIFEKYDAVVKK